MSPLRVRTSLRERPTRPLRKYLEQNNH